MVLYAAFLLCSLVWIDLTRMYIEEITSTLGMVAIVAVLWTAVRLRRFCRARLAGRDRLKGKLVVAGSVMLSIQCTWWDALYWVMNFGF